MFRLEFVSNSPFQESEYHKWVEDCAAHGTELPSMVHVSQKQKDINDLLYYQFSSEDIDKVRKEGSSHRGPRNEDKEGKLGNFEQYLPVIYVLVQLILDLPD